MAVPKPAATVAAPKSSRDPGLKAVIGEDAYARLADEATARGVPLAHHVRDVVRRAVHVPDGPDTVGALAPPKPGR